MGENDFADVTPLSSEDGALFAELRAVLMKHGALDRFGIALLHSHFDVREGERLVESVDVASRTLTIRPEEVQPRSDGAVATSWRFVADDARPQERLICWPVRDEDGDVVGHMM